MSIKIQSVFDDAFSSYGRVVEGEDFTSLLNKLEEITEAPSDSVIYIASDAELEASVQYSFLSDNCFGGMPIQIGYCNGTNTKLNCLEYHKDNEINIAADDIILLLAKLQDVRNGVIDTSKVEAFLCPKGCAVELYMTTMHYAPCSSHSEKPFRVIIVLPKGTNVGMPEIMPKNNEDKMLFARNKWLLAHPESNEAKAGALIGLTGDNIDIKDSI